MADAGLDAFVAEAGVMLQAVERLDQVAPLDTTVLITGESGTGKELAARRLHTKHPGRRHGPFVCVHCGAIPESLLESELFGHVRGAFTGADRDRVGRFEQADGGTLFLDEISTMSPGAQVRLLRVLQDRTVCRVGAGEARRVHVRVVVASNENLRALVEEGRFRLDLYYRISAFPVHLPPLRERLADIAPLAEVFARKTAARIGLERPKRLSPQALEALAAYRWPGNVRELENVIEYASIVSGDRDTIHVDDLPHEISGLPAGHACAASVRVPEEGLSFRTAVTQLERELILQSLRMAEGNKARAAELLHLKRTTFLEKLRRLEEEGWIPARYPERFKARPSGEAMAS